MRRIALPVSQPTICAFGGPDLDVLYVASASRFLDERSAGANRWRAGFSPFMDWTPAVSGPRFQQ